MSLRLAQVTEPRTFDVLDFDLLRGATSVTTAGTVYVARSGYTSWVTGHFTASGTIPGSGTWTISLPELPGLDPQYFGRVMVGAAFFDLTYATTGVLSFATAPTITAGTIISIQGALS